MSGFPITNGNAREKFDVLYNLSIQDKHVVLLVQSNVEAEWKDGFKGVDSRNVHVDKKDISAAIYDFKPGELFLFRLVANPSKKIKCEGKPNSRRIFLASEDEQFEWLKRKSEQFGFTIYKEQIRIKKMDNSYGFKKGIAFQRAQYEGILCVNQKELFSQAFCKGIGSEKAFGCGMLLLKKVKR